MQVQLLTPTARAPARQSDQAAGYDLHIDEGLTLFPGQRKLVSTGLAIAVPHGYYGRIAPRSGLAVKKGIDIGAGVIDSDYRGPVKILLLHNGKETLEIERGDRIAQLILEKITLPEIEVVAALDNTERGEGGFGSTGK
jgi:dUTP pyrophosphatase